MLPANLSKAPREYGPGFDPLRKMASFHEQGSNSDVDTKAPVVSVNAVAERRRAALAEVDNAKFS